MFFSPCLLLHSLATAFPVYFLETLSPLDYFFSSLRWGRKIGRGWSGEELSSASRLKLWQSDFSWKFGFCYGKDDGHISQWLFFFPSQSQERIFLRSSSWECGRIPMVKVHVNMRVPPKFVIPPGISHSYASPYSVYSNLSKLPFKCSYSIWISVVFSPGKWTLGPVSQTELTQHEKKIQVTLYLIQRLNSLLKIFSEKQSKTPGPDRFNGEYYETQNVETTSILHKMFVKIE